MTYYQTAAQSIRQYFNQVQISTLLFDSMVHGHGSWGITEFFWLWRFSFSFSSFGISTVEQTVYFINVS